MNSVTRSFEILELVADHQETGLGFSDIVQRLQCPDNSVLRLLEQLTDLNCLIFDEGARRYRVGFRLARIGACVTSSLSLTKEGRIFLRKLFEESGHTCSLGVLEKDHGVYVDVCANTRYGIRLLSEVGKDFPLHCTAIGKVLLADMPSCKRHALLPERLPAYTKSSITDWGALERQLGDVAARGYAEDKEEAARGVTCIAAPVFNAKGRVIAAVSASCPSFACEAESDRTSLIRMVKECGMGISKAFGYGVPGARLAAGSTSRPGGCGVGQHSA